ncbi:MAG: outer membrane protein assembly factor BamB family protein [Planctomycetota bacterium]|jgi:outer membrane protein assembly factor BamB
MKHFTSFPKHVFCGALLALCGAFSLHAQSFDPVKDANLHGGLIVQLGASQTETASQLSNSGRYLIHLLDPNSQSIESARSRIKADGHYGLAWAEFYPDLQQLPYAENTVNLIVATDYTTHFAEILRVLTPGGTLVVTNTRLAKAADLKAAGFDVLATGGSKVIARKPLHENMDEWSHPRHAADGNAAAATSEVEGMVTAGGRNFYGGIMARDSYNGLRLWHRDINQDAENNPDIFNLPRLSQTGARPIASEHHVFTVQNKRPVALDAATGEIAIVFEGMKFPNAIFHDGDRVVAGDTESVCAFNAKTGDLLWRFDASEPLNLIGDGEIVTFTQGRARRGEKAEAVALDAETGAVNWRRNDYPWIEKTVRTVLSNGLLAFEVSSLNDNDAGNGLHLVFASNGEHAWSKNYPPGMNHRRQARAMFLDNDLWILHGGKINYEDKENMERVPVEISALNPLTGETRVTYPVGLAHCFPPVATSNYMFAGELDLTDLQTGDTVANRITKANCSRENGWVPANGLIYTTPKHCTCWPMLRGFVAMAPAKPDDANSVANTPVDELEFTLIKGPASVDPNAPQPLEHDWPLYRHDPWRSGSAVTDGPRQLKPIWTATLKQLGADKPLPNGPILHDWKENPIIKGPLSAPTIANGLAYVTRPNQHELLAIDTATGDVQWRFTANGRLDTPPAIHRGLCLFGSADGWVYALRADNGRLVWKLRAAPSDERIVSYGQVESPWPVPGAVLVMDNVAYFAAGRQPLADGGILVFSVDPMTGEKNWVKRIDTVPQKGFYENSGLEFDPFDILHAEGDGLAMSRWVISRDGEETTVDKWNAFAKLKTGVGEVWIPRGSWTYGARHQDRFAGEAPRRPLVTFRDDNVFSSLNSTTEVFRRQFDLEQIKKFNSKWITGWEASRTARTEGGTPFRTHRIAEGAEWTSDPFLEPGEEPAPPIKPGTQRANQVHAMALAGNDRLYVIHQDGRLKEMSASEGYVMSEAQVDPPAWDGLAIAEKRLYLTTQKGEIVCLGEEE